MARSSPPLPSPRRLSMPGSTSTTRNDPTRAWAWPHPPNDSPNAQRGRCPTWPPTLRVLTDDRAGDDWVARTVSSVGTISVSNQVVSVGRHRSGEIVDVHVREQLLDVWIGNELVKTVLRSSIGEVRKKKAERH